MKRIHIIAIVAILLANSVQVFPQAEPEQKMGIAVLDFKPSGVAASESSFVSDFFRSALVSAKAFRLIDKSNMDKVLSEQGFQQTGCTSQECAVQMGKLLNVKAMVTGTFGMFLGDYVISIGMVNVETGEIVYSDNKRCKDPGQIQSVVEEMATSMVADRTGKAVAKPVQKAPEPEARPEEEAIRAYRQVVEKTAKETTVSYAKSTIIKIDGNQVNINLGNKNDIRKNDVLDIYAVVQQIKSPISGQIIKERKDSIAKIKITYVEDYASMGSIISLKPGRKVEVGQEIRVGGEPMVKFRLDMLTDVLAMTSFLPEPNPNIKFPEFHSQVDLRLPVLKVGYGMFSNNFLGTSWMQPMVSYYTVSLNSDNFEIGVGITKQRGLGYCGILRAGNMNNIKGGIDIRAWVGRADDTDTYDYSLATVHDGQTKVEATLGGLLSNSGGMYIRGKLDRGTANYWGASVYDANLGTQNLDSIQETRYGLMIDWLVKPVRELSIRFGYGLYAYVGYWNYTGATTSRKNDFVSLLGLLGLSLKLTRNVSIGADFEAEMNPSLIADGLGFSPSIRSKVEIGF